MDTVKVKVSDYYGVPTYYSVMPVAIFDVLETAALCGDEYVELNRALYDAMIEDYNSRGKA